MKMRKTVLTVSLLILTGSVYAGSETWTTQNFWGYGEWAHAGDFNGDGRHDIASPFANNWSVKTSNGVNGFTNSTEFGCNFTFGWGTWQFVRIGDFDGNGFDDYVSPYGGTAHLYGFFGGTCPTYQNRPINSSWGDHSYTFVGDFNGDGYDDVASAYGTNVYMKFGRSSVMSAGFTSATWTVTNQWGAGTYTKAGDFNGDGLTDLASMTGGTAYMKLSTGSGFTSTTWAISSLWNQGGYTFAGDFNNDGYDDVASCGGSICYMKQSTGSGFINPGNQSINSSWAGPVWTMVGDFEGDGNDDIASVSGGSVFMKLISQ